MIISSLLIDISPYAVLTVIVVSSSEILSPFIDDPSFKLKISSPIRQEIDIIKIIKPHYYCKGPDYKNFKDDITNQIQNSVKAVVLKFNKIKQDLSNQHKGKNVTWLQLRE